MEGSEHKKKRKTKTKKKAKTGSLVQRNLVDARKAGGDGDAHATKTNYGDLQTMNEDSHWVSL